MITKQNFRKSFLQSGLVGLAAFLLFSGIATYWMVKHVYPITGDEPHYLVIADSIQHDGDARLEDEYNSRIYGVNPQDDLQVVRTATGWWSVHHIGLPILLVVPQMLGRFAGQFFADPKMVDGGGVFFSKLLLMALAAAGLGLAQRVLAGQLGNKPAAMAAGLALAFGLPFMIGAGQIYPDLPAGALLFALCWLILFRARQDRLGQIATILLLAFLPWMHLKLALPVIPLAIAFLWRDLARGKLANVAAKSAIPALSVLGLLAYNYTATGNALTGPFPPGIVTDPSQVLMIFLGIHLDQFQGIFIQHPFLLLGVMGLPVMFVARPKATLVWAAVYLAVTLPNAAHFVWYGGYAFAGRFGWTAVWLWIIPLVFGLGAIQRRAGAIPIFVLCALSAVYQIALLPKWLPASANGFLMNRGIWTPLWATSGFFSGWWMNHLPSFSRFETYLYFLPNYAGALFCFALVLIGAVLITQRKWARIAGVVMVVCVLGLVAQLTRLYTKSKPDQYVSSAVYLRSDTGKVVGLSRIAGWEETTKPGFLIFGPYLHLQPGLYRATLRYSFTDEKTADKCYWDVVLDHGTNKLAEGLFPVTGPGVENDVTAQFAIDSQGMASLLEFRAYYAGGGILRVDRLTIEPVY